MQLIKKTDYLQENHIGRKIAEILAIDYDENQFLEEEFLDNSYYYRKKREADDK